MYEMEDIKFCFLDYNSESELLEYEKKLYDAFYEKYTSNVQVYGKIWCLIDDRMKPTIEYTDQIVYIAKSDSQIVWSLSANTNTAIKMQFEDMGFSITEEERNQGIGEVLALFTRTHINPYKFVSAFVEDFCYSDLRSRGVKMVYTTCSNHVLKTYLRIGFTLKDQKVINGEEKFLLEKQL